MDKNGWVAFLSSKIKSQISLEAVGKAQTWGIAILGFLSLGFALSALGASVEHPLRIQASKILFLFFFHFYALTQFFIPGILQKGQKPIAKMLQIRDFSSLVTVFSVVGFYALVSALLAWQVASANHSSDAYDTAKSGISFLSIVGWTNVIACGAAFLGFLFYITSLFNFPNLFIKWIEKGSRAIYGGAIFSAALLILTGLGMASVQPIGSPDFFQTFQIAGLFWIFIGCSILLAGRLNRESSVPALSNLEIDLLSGRLERMELVVPRFKDAFVNSRFENWLKTFARDIAEKSAEITKYSKEAVGLVSVEKPSEMDLRQVEERYRKSEQAYKLLEKNHQRFMVSMVGFTLSEVEIEKAALVRDQFSRELRNAKLELASIRKLIDDKLVSLKNHALKMTSQETQALEELTLKS